MTLPNGERTPARIVARDFSRELILLKVDASKLPIAMPPGPTAADGTGREFGQRVGQWAIALGKTYDAGTVSQSIGIISGFGRVQGRAIQTDAKVSPINYGGPLIDLTGRTLGILAPLSPGDMLEGGGQELYDSGIGFAVPLTDILERLPRLQEGTDIHPGKLGLVASDQNEMSGPVVAAGAVPGSPAARAGIQEGDIIVEAVGQDVGILADLRQALGPIDAGQAFNFRVVRQGQEIDLNCELIAEIPVYRRRYLGLRLQPAETSGLKIVDIEPDSPADQSTLQIDQTITACNGKDLQDGQELHALVAVAELDRPLRLNVLTDDGQSEAVELLAVARPDELPQSLPPIDARVKPDMLSDLVDIKLGDFPNKAYALVPALANQRELGLLVVFPEPGELTSEQTKDHWSDFARDYGWIVAVVNSADPRRWTSEELELAGRVIGRLQKNYSIDSARLVVAGLGIGGRFALLAGTMLRDRVAAVMTIGTRLEKVVPRVANLPLQSIDFLLVGDVAMLAASAENLRGAGYCTSVLAAPGLESQKWETHPVEPIQLWLEGLARY